MQYYQCSFRGANSVDVIPADEEREVRAWLAQLGLLLDLDYHPYLGAGEFLRADTLLLLRRGRQHRILALDASVFSVRALSDVRDLTRVEDLFDLLQADVAHLASRSFFSRLCIDTSADAALAFSADLRDYFAAFMRSDKESVKLIQAASYARSFVHFLSAQGLLPDPERLLCNVVGYTDRGLNTLAVRPHEMGLLDACHSIYTSYRQAAKGRQVDLARERDRVVRLIERNAARSFMGGRDFVRAIMDQAAHPGHGVVRHSETLEDFQPIDGPVPADVLAACGLEGPLPLRAAHAALVRRGLEGDPLFLFLTANPGIGKTTAIAEALKARVDEGFLLLYASPRTQVNLDIIEKFRDPATGAFWDPRLLGLTANKLLISDNGGHPTVQYMSSAPSGAFACRGVDFLDQETVLAHAAGPHAPPPALGDDHQREGARQGGERGRRAVQHLPRDPRRHRQRPLHGAGRGGRRAEP